MHIWWFLTFLVVFCYVDILPSKYYQQNPNILTNTAPPYSHCCLLQCKHHHLAMVYRGIPSDLYPGPSNPTTFLGLWSLSPTQKTSSTLYNISSSITISMLMDTQLQKNACIDDVQSTILNLELFVMAINEWCSSRQLNADKTELIWFGSRTKLRRLSQVDTSLQLYSFLIKPVMTVQNLGVYIDNELNMEVHNGNVASICFYHLWRLHQLRCVLCTPSSMQRLVGALFLSWLDYCNSMLADLPFFCYTGSATKSFARCSSSCSESRFPWSSDSVDQSFTLATDRLLHQSTSCVTWCTWLLIDIIQSTSLRHLYWLHFYSTMHDCDCSRPLLLMCHK